MTRSGLALAHLSSRTLFASLALLIASGIFAPLQAQDVTAPDPVTDLATDTVSTSSIKLTWDRTGRRRSDRDGDDVRRPLLDEHDHRGQLGVGHAGERRAFPAGRGQQ